MRAQPHQLSSSGAARSAAGAERCPPRPLEQHQGHPDQHQYRREYPAGVIFSPSTMAPSANAITVHQCIGGHFLGRHCATRNE